MKLQEGGEEVREGKVVLGTIHGAKGLEYDAVFVPRCNKGHLPMDYWAPDAAWPLPQAPVDSYFQPAQLSVNMPRGMTSRRALLAC